MFQAGACNNSSRRKHILSGKGILKLHCKKIVKSLHWNNHFIFNILFNIHHVNTEYYTCTFIFTFNAPCFRWNLLKNYVASMKRAYFTTGQSCYRSKLLSARLSVLSSELGPPTPPPLLLPPLNPRGETHSLGGGGGDQIPTKRQTLWYSTVQYV